MVGKLARYLGERERKQVMLASLDTYRPAAREQLSVLASQLGSTRAAPDDARHACRAGQGRAGIGAAAGGRCA
jgi:signal recognition particle subunit SRP54